MDHHQQGADDKYPSNHNRRLFCRRRHHHNLIGRLDPDENSSAAEDTQCRSLNVVVIEHTADDTYWFHVDSSIPCHDPSSWHWHFQLWLWLIAKVILLEPACFRFLTWHSDILVEMSKTCDRVSAASISKQKKMFFFVFSFLSSSVYVMFVIVFSSSWLITWPGMSEPSLHLNSLFCLYMLDKNNSIRTKALNLVEYCKNNQGLQRMGICNNNKKKQKTKQKNIQASTMQSGGRPLRVQYPDANISLRKLPKCYQKW